LGEGDCVINIRCLAPFCTFSLYNSPLDRINATTDLHSGHEEFEESVDERVVQTLLKEHQLSRNDVERQVAG